jgi:hypothetical protein
MSIFSLGLLKSLIFIFFSQKATLIALSIFVFPTSFFPTNTVLFGQKLIVLSFKLL